MGWRFWNPSVEDRWLEARQATEAMLSVVQPLLPPEYVAEVDLSGVRLYVCGPETLRRLRASHGEQPPQAAAFAAGHWRGKVDIYTLGGGPLANGIPFADPWGIGHELTHVWHQRLMQGDEARDLADHLCEGL